MFLTVNEALDWALTYIQNISDVGENKDFQEALKKLESDNVTLSDARTKGIIALFEGSDVICVGDSPMLSHVDTEDFEGHESNEVVRASWTDVEGEYQVKFTEGGIAQGHWEGKSFVCEDSEGYKVNVNFYELHPITK